MVLGGEALCEDTYITDNLGHGIVCIASSFSGSTDPDTGTVETGQQTDSATNCNCNASTSSKGDSASDSDCGGVDDGQGSGDVTAGKAISESSSWQEELGRQQYDAWELVGLRHCEVARNGAGMFADGGAAVRLLAGGASAEAPEPFWRRSIFTLNCSAGSNPSSAADAEGEGDEQAGKGSFVSRTVVAGNETDVGAGSAQCVGDVSVGCAAELAARPWARPPPSTPRNPSRSSELYTLNKQQQRRRQTTPSSHSTQLLQQPQPQQSEEEEVQVLRRSPRSAQQSALRHSPQRGGSGAPASALAGTLAGAPGDDYDSSDRGERAAAPLHDDSPAEIEEKACGGAGVIAVDIGMSRGRTGERLECASSGATTTPTDCASSGATTTTTTDCASSGATTTTTTDCASSGATTTTTNDCVPTSSQWGSDNQKSLQPQSVLVAAAGDADTALSAAQAAVVDAVLTSTTKPANVRRKRGTDSADGTDGSGNNTSVGAGKRSRKQYVD